MRGGLMQLVAYGAQDVYFSTPFQEINLDNPNQNSSGINNINPRSKNKKINQPREILDLDFFNEKSAFFSKPQTECQNKIEEYDEIIEFNFKAK